MHLSVAFLILSYSLTALDYVMYIFFNQKLFIDIKSHHLFSPHEPTYFAPYRPNSSKSLYFYFFFNFLLLFVPSSFLLYFSLLPHSAKFCLSRFFVLLSCLVLCSKSFIDISFSILCSAFPSFHPFILRHSMFFIKLFMFPLFIFRNSLTIIPFFHVTCS